MINLGSQTGVLGKGIVRSIDGKTVLLGTSGGLIRVQRPVFDLRMGEEVTFRGGQIVSSQRDEKDLLTYTV